MCWPVGQLHLLSIHPSGFQRLRLEFGSPLHFLNLMGVVSARLNFFLVFTGKHSREVPLKGPQRQAWSSELHAAHSPEPTVPLTQNWSSSTQVLSRLRKKKKACQEVQKQHPHLGREHLSAPASGLGNYSTVARSLRSPEERSLC